MAQYLHNGLARHATTIPTTAGCLDTLLQVRSEVFYELSGYSEVMKVMLLARQLLQFAQPKTNL